MPLLRKLSVDQNESACRRDKPWIFNIVVK